MIPVLMLAAATLDCHPVSSDRILGSDLAAAEAVFAGLPPDLVVSYSPRPGLPRFLEPAELQRIARANGLDAEGVVSLCFERPAAPPTREAAIAAMRKSLDSPDARLDILELSKYPVPAGEMVFPRAWLAEPRSGDSATWNGYIQYDGGRFPVWARVRIGVRQQRVVAAVDLRPANPVKPGDIYVEEVFDFPRRVVPLSSPADVVGRIPRRLIAAGQTLSAVALVEPNDVSPGETVVVEVRSGAAVLKLEAKAESAGRRGDIVSVLNAASGKRFRARVEEKGRVLVDCGTSPESPR